MRVCCRTILALLFIILPSFNHVLDLPIEAAELTFNQRYINNAVERMFKTVPAGADVSSWRH